MNKTKSAFAHGKAFIPFITAGDPNLATTEKLVCAMAEAGADLIELGLPFSDPVAEGPVIQQADERALTAGTTTDRVFEAIARIRKSCQVPIAIMTYVNPVFVYGAEKFMERCSQTGVCAVIVPDLPYEEQGELKPACQKHNIDLVTLIAPTSKDRIHSIAKDAQGFLYCVSSLGVTGVRSQITTNIGEMIARVREVSDIPCAVGFGISTPQQAAEMARFADGIIVGSAIVRLVAQYGEASVVPAAAYVKEMKAAIRGC